MELAIIPQLQDSNGPLNLNMTKKLQEDPKFKAYLQWAKDNGAILEKIHFPAAFGKDDSFLVGSAAKEDIKHNEAFIFIPNKLLITIERAHNSEIGHIFQNHDSVFKANEDRDFLTLLLFVMFEHQKGESSFWHPYFQAVDPGTLTCYWDHAKYIEQLDDSELRYEIEVYRKQMDDDWKIISKLLKIYSPDYFNLEVCTFELYKHCSAFIATRCFGWGLPTTILAPIADSFNHSSKSSQVVDFVNKRLHLQQNKIYTHLFDFESESASAENDVYQKETSKLKLNVKRLFKEDLKVQADPEQSKMIEGEDVDFEKMPNRYKLDEVYQRFVNLLRAEKENPGEKEEIKKLRFPEHGFEIWGLGYVTSDHSEDEDDQDGDDEDCAYIEDLRRKILSYTNGVEFDMEEFETISSNTRLREIYSYRWWQDNDSDNYFVMVNKGGKPLRSEQQIYYNYGSRNNSYLLQNYGFVLDENNQYNTLHFRVIVGTNPKAALESLKELFPDVKILEDRDNLDTTTEVIRVPANRPSESLMNYLRSVLQNNYEGDDCEFLMISTPRLLDFELLVVDWALDMLEHYGKSKLFQRSTLEEDLIRLRAVADFRMRSVLCYNIERKRLYHSHVKLLKVMKAILQRIATGQMTFSQACFTRVQDVEDADSEWELFRRRMGLRHYFKELKMNMARIQKAKDARDPSSIVKAAKGKKKVVKKAAASGEEPSRESTSSQLSPIKEEKKKKPREGSKTRPIEGKQGSGSKPVAKKKTPATTKK